MTDDFVLTTRFVKNPDLSDGKATAILDCLKTVLKENHVPPPVLSKVFGLGSDGASVTTGDKGGMSTLMKKENSMLAASDIAKLKNYQQIITDIYYYFSKSAKRSQGLKKVQEVLESDVLKIKEVHSVRWFSFYNALYAIYHSWGALVTYFASHAKSDAKAKGFVKKITEYEFIGITHFLIDIIPITTQLNLVFQKQDLDLAAVSPVVDATVQRIKVACEQGKHQKDLKEKLKGSEFTLEEHMVKVSASQILTVQKVKADFVEALESNLQKRFPKESMNVVSAFEVLTLRSLSFVPREVIDDYGNDKLEILTEHYRKKTTENREWCYCSCN
ncbi:uncharacterized protein LOC110062925 [Orbicella faveolata]|uniref:uncharacterized protein LOC110062925 n=1 Tax=Orbicella faveolata TaxID=48498 RepID=UPI0009E199C2|nr:uncharacterized protein LOC110062925 [Orbicella faveolata]